MTPALTTMIETALSTVQTDVFALIAVALPVGLAIMGVFMAIKLGVRFFKSVAK